LSATFPVSVALILTLVACQRPLPPTAADASIRADCRQTVEREYAAQNRADLTRRDERDLPFASSYNSGVASRGLGAEYSRDQLVTDCLRAHADGADQPSPGVGPALSPINRGPGSTSLTP
jgi:hypothetical protein